MVLSPSRQQLAMDALVKAEAVRKKVGLKMNDPACVYDIAEQYGLQVRFEKVPGLDGLYSKEKGLILLSSLRPPGRQAYNCAHEFGHHIYDHGFSVTLDEDIVEQMERGSRGPEEYLVDRFASFLLMPKIAVKNGFARRGWKLDDMTPKQVMAISGWLGVGYTTLIHHMQATLSLLSWPKAKELLKTKPKEVRANVLGRETAENLVLVDTHWFGRAVDIRVGDLISVPSMINFEGRSAEIVEDDGNYKVVRGKRAGIGKLYDTKSDWASFVRVSKREYAGLSTYRHLEDPDDD